MYVTNKAHLSLNIEEEDPDYIHIDVENCYKLYFKQGKSNESTLNEKKKKKSFGGLLYFLKSDINVYEHNVCNRKTPVRK